MKNLIVRIEGIPEGANYIIARDTGAKTIQKEDIIEKGTIKDKAVPEKKGEQLIMKNTGRIRHRNQSGEPLIFRVRKAGYKPIELKTSELTQLVHYQVMEVDKLYTPPAPKTKKKK